MQDKNRGEATVPVPVSRLSPSDLQRAAEKRLGRQGKFPRSRKRPVAQELLFAPYFYFRFRNPRLRANHFIYDVLMDGVLGYCEFVRGSFKLQELPIAAGLLLEKTVPKEEAEAKARQAVEAFVLRRQSLWIKEIKVELMDMFELYYPYWVCYLESADGIELLALNGLSGSPAGERPEKILRAAISRAEWRDEQGRSA